MPRPPLQNPEEFSKDFRIVVHVMQRVVAQQMAKCAWLKRHGVAIAMRKNQQTRVDTAIRLRPAFKAGLQVAVDIEGNCLQPHPRTKLRDPTGARTKIQYRLIQN